MKTLINLFVRRPVTVIMIFSALIIAAIFSLFSLPVSRLPEIIIPRVTVETIYPGMAANEIRSLVTIPLEDGLSPIKGLEKTQSVSRDNRSLISLDFRWGTDTMAASVLVREAIDAVYTSLPEGVNKPAVTTGDSVNEPHAVIAVSAHNGSGELARKFAEYEMQARLRRIDGVRNVVLVGGEIKEEKLSIDVQRLAALGISPSEFTYLLAQETSDIPAGNACEGNTELVVVSSGRPDSVGALSKIILPFGNGALKVEDTGEILSSTVRKESVFVYNGKEAAALEIYRRPGADPLRLSRDIKKALNETVGLFSRDVQIELVTDSTSTLVAGIKALLISAALAVGAVIIVIFIFIRRLKHSVLAALSIPFSAAAGICVLAVTGKSLNSMSLAGLAMGIGLVSDISILILDLLHRSFKNRETAPEPDEVGEKTSSISGSSVASTITTAVVFAPIVMLPGVLGSLFGDIAVALVASVCAGWFYAQFCLPSLYLLFFSFHTTVFTNGSLEKKYSSLLSVCFKSPGKLIAVAVIISVFGFFSLLIQPAAFLNSDESEEIWVSVNCPPGTLLETSVEKFIETSQVLSGLPFVKTVYGRAGAEKDDVKVRADINYKKEELIFRCELNKKIKPEGALAEINRVLKSFDKFEYSAYFPRDRAEVLLGLSSERTYVIKGKDRSELLDRKKTAEEIFTSSLIDVNFRPLGQRPELRLYPNRETSAYLSIPSAQIAETLFILNEGVIASRLEIEGRPLNVRVTGAEKAQEDIVKHLEQIPIRTSQGKTVYLGSLGKIEQREVEASLARLDRSDIYYADIEKGNEIPSEAKEFVTQADESVFNRYRASLLIYVFFVLILLYMTMGAQFESFLLPLILMVCIPFSLSGASLMLLITGAKIDSGAILGLTALFGLVVNNSLVLFEISEQKINASVCIKNFSVEDAVQKGARERLQAILITLATTVFALLPLIVSPLGNSQKSMASAMMGGLVISTLLSLFAIPVILVRYFKWKLQKDFLIQEKNNCISHNKILQDVMK